MASSTQIGANQYRVTDDGLEPFIMEGDIITVDPTVKLDANCATACIVIAKPGIEKYHAKLAPSENAILDVTIRHGRIRMLSPYYGQDRVGPEVVDILPIVSLSRAFISPTGITKEAA